jgi:trimethylamine--corrinoid protein Co-methyltransferase
MTDFMPDDTARPNFRLLSEKQILTLHQATVQLLETCGVRVMHPAALELLRQAGCKVQGDDCVLIPGWLVEQCIRSAPSSVAIYNRLGKPAMQLGGRNNYYGMGTDLIRTQDLYSGETRPSRLQDVINAARLADSCDNIDFISSFALPGDAPTNLMYLSSFKAELENSTKPIFFTAAGKEDLAYMIEMAAAVAGGSTALREKPFLIHYSEPTSPLTHSYGALSKLFLCAQQGIPICYTPAAMLGGSAPVTLAGGLVQTNAEALSGIVMHQLMSKSAPIICGMALPALDMKTSCIAYAAPEARLGHAACADLFHYYRLPVWSTTGSDAHTFDGQAMAEHALCLLMASLEGSNLIHDVGYLGQGLLGNPAMLVMCDELISYVKRLMRGFEINTEAIGLDSIAQVGPGGNYLTDKLTIQHFRKELWQPSLFNRDNPDGWVKKGGKSQQERVIQRAIQLLETHLVEPLPGKIAARLVEIAAEAETKLAGMQFVA